MHLCFSITSHGFGHGAISCSVINRLMTYYPNIKISVMTLLPKSYLNSRLSNDFDYYQIGSDFGMLMSSPIGIDIENSRKKYQHLFENWQLCVNTEKQLLREIQPNILISNISPISLDAAQQLGIKTASVCPFNWAQIYHAYCLSNDDNSASKKAVYQKMKSVYQVTDQVFKPLPFVPLDDGNEIAIASINDQPVADLEHLLESLPKNTSKIGLIALGGLAFPLNLQCWPKIDGLHWLVDQSIPSLRTDMSHISAIKQSFLQLVASSDFIITKPGYGTYCEVASIAKYKKIRVVSLVRPDWPETPYLNKFLMERVPFVEVNEKQLTGEALKGVIETLSKRPYPAEFLCEDGAMQLIEMIYCEN
jgi:predicted DNA-binding antitoxin AbrB/MazE fold protein